MTNHDTDTDTDAVTAPLPPPLAALVVKDHVHLGGLTHESRLQVLALLWAGLPKSPIDERGVNELLKAQLAGPGLFLATDHVELRRWLVDMGFLARDGFGRVYECVALSSLTEAARAAAATLGSSSAADLAAACRHARERRIAQRAQRRAAWEASAAGAAPL